MMWVYIGIAVAVAFAAWMWYELKHPLDAWDGGDSTSGKPQDVISREFEKWHSEAMDAREMSPESETK